MKINLISYLPCLLLSAQLLAQPTSITVPLASVDTYPAKSYSQVGTSQSADFTVFKGIPDYLVEKVIRSSNTVRGQSQFEEYQKGKLTAEAWKKVKASYGRDTVGLSPTPLRHRINALVGTDRQGRRVVIVDANNNQDFSDDRVLYYRLTLPEIERHKDGYYTHAIQAVVDTLPAVQVKLEAFDGRKIVPRTAWVKPNPYNTGWLYKRSSEGQFHLSLYAFEYRKGSVLLAGKPLYIVVKSGIAGLPYNTQATTIEISQDEKASSASRDVDVYKLGESFVLNNRRIKIQSVSMAGDKIQLTDVGSAENTLSRPATN